MQQNLKLKSTLIYKITYKLKIKKNNTKKKFFEKILKNIKLLTINFFFKNTEKYTNL